MSHAGLAYAGAVVGALGAVVLLLGRGRPALVAGLVLLGLAELGLAAGLVPGEDLEQLVGSGRGIVAVVAGVALVALLTAVFVRCPAAVPVACLAAAPFRIPVELGNQEAFLLVPLYVVLLAGVLALATRALRGAQPAPLPRWVAAPAAAFVALSALSLLWSADERAGTILLLFFLLPFTALLVVVAAAPLASWSRRALVVVLVGLASAFAIVGLSQLWTGDLYFARDLEVANAYTSYLRTTSLFGDSSIYARELVVALVLLVAVVWVGRMRVALAAPVAALLWVGLWFSYSQSSMVALVAGVLAVGLLGGPRRERVALCVAASILGALAIAAAVVGTGGASADRVTSGRTSLVENTARVFAGHPVAGVGVGGQPVASRDEGGRRSKERNASHTTPLTVAAELGVLGLAAYVAFLAGAVRLLLEALRRDRALGLALSGVFVVLVVHSLLYAGFFENPLTWGVLAVAIAGVRQSQGDAPEAPAKPVEQGPPSPCPEVGAAPGI